MFRRPKAPGLYDSAATPKVGKARRVARWWMGSTKTLVFSGVLLSLVGAVGIFLVLVPPPEVSNPVAGSAVPGETMPAATTPTQAPLTAPPGSAACKAQKAVEVPPETLIMTTFVTQWYPMGTMLAPKSKTGGPQKEGAFQCFTRTPEGALYAVATRVAIEARKDGAAGRQFSGYQWLSYGPDLATLSLAARSTTGNADARVTSRTFQAVWDQNDWQISVIDQPIAYLDDTRTFTTWGGA